MLLTPRKRHLPGKDGSEIDGPILEPSVRPRILHHWVRQESCSMMCSMLQRDDTRRPGKARTTKVHLRVETLECRALLTVNVLNSFPGLNSPGTRLRPPDPDVAA